MLDLTATDAQVRCRPMGDRVLILPEDDRTSLDITDENTGAVHKIHIPDTHTEREEPRRGRVLAVGAGKWLHNTREPMDLQPGMRVAFSRNAGSDITIGDVSYLLVHERDVFAVVDEGA